MCAICICVGGEGKAGDVYIYVFYILKTKARVMPCE